MKKLVVLVKDQLAQCVRKEFEKHRILDSCRSIRKIPGCSKVALPICSFDKSVNTEDFDVIREKIAYCLKTSDNIGLHSADFDIVVLDLPTARKCKLRTPRECMVENLSWLLHKRRMETDDALMAEIPCRWEKHGDLVMLPADAFVSHLWNDLGNDVWQIVADAVSCQRVARKTTVSRDGFRTPQVELLLGNSGWVEHVDNGIRYCYDVCKCMFSAGNISEKLRVANLNCTGQTVVDLYAGIGYFTLPYLVHAGAAHVHACEWNPDAVQALQHNLRLNGVEDKCTVHHGDNRQACPVDVADRVNLGLIPSSEEGWPVACKALKSSGGFLHIHSNVTTKAPSTDGKMAIPKSNNGTEATYLTLDDCTGQLSTQNSLHYLNDWNTTGSAVQGSFSAEGTHGCPSGGPVEEKSVFTSRPHSCVNSEVDVRVVNIDPGKSALEMDTTFSTDEVAPVHSSSNLVSPDSEFISADSEHTESLLSIGSHCPVSMSLATDGSGKTEEASPVHIQWQKWSKSVVCTIEEILFTLHKHPWTTSVLHIEHVKSYAPHIDHLVLDIECRPERQQTAEVPVP